MLILGLYPLGSIRYKTGEELIKRGKRESEEVSEKPLCGRSEEIESCRRGRQRRLREMKKRRRTKTA